MYGKNDTRRTTQDTRETAQGATQGAREATQGTRHKTHERRGRAQRGLIIFAVVLLVGAAAVFWHLRHKAAKANGEVIQTVRPEPGAIQNIVSSTATVLPRNRLEIKPPVNGRVEEILVAEGQKVASGQVLARMSSTERAAIMDAARGRGEEDAEYWKEVYKAIPLISPISAEVIVAKTQPGQTVTTAEPVIVLSDRLIVRAQVDETDIGKIRQGLDASVTLDAYPDTTIPAKVGHIYYESKTVNNVTMYEVDVLPDEVPAVLRSGMNTTVNFVVQRRQDVFTLPLAAVQKDEAGDYVFVRDSRGNPARQAVELGIADDRNVEIISGIGAGDTVVVRTKKYALPKSSVGKNPFMPDRRSRTDRRQ